MKKLGSYLFLALFMSNERYTRNRNMWKKNYSTVRHKPRFLEVVVNETTRSINLETYQRHRSYYALYPDYGSIETILPPEPVLFEWEDGKYTIDTPDENGVYTINFAQSFSEPPIVCLTCLFAFSPSLDIQPIGPGWEKASPFIYGYGPPNVTGVSFRMSYPYTGSITYLATKPVAPTVYPIDVVLSSNFGSLPYQVSANTEVSDGTGTQTIDWNPITVTANPNQVFVFQTPFFYPADGTEEEATRIVRTSPTSELHIGPATTVSSSNTNVSDLGNFVYHYIAISPL